MQSALLCFFAIVACASAIASEPPGYAEKYPETLLQSRSFRHPRDLTWEHSAGRGKVFGTLGSTDDSVFGTGGYKQDIFNDGRGHLQGQAYGSRVLSDYGDNSRVGGKLDWSNANENARAALDVHKDIGRGSGMTLSGDGVWKLDHNTRLVAGGRVHKNFGHDRPELGAEARIEHDW